MFHSWEQLTDGYVERQMGQRHIETKHEIFSYNAAVQDCTGPVAEQQSAKTYFQNISYEDFGEVYVELSLMFM